MAFTVHITKTETGETRLHEVPDYDWSDEGPGEFIWTEGNFGCDCNRHIFFNAAGDEPEPSDDDWCSHDRFKICVTDSAGVEIYKEESK